MCQPDQKYDWTQKGTRDLGARYDRIVGYGEGTSTQIGN